MYLHVTYSKLHYVAMDRTAHGNIDSAGIYHILVGIYNNTIADNIASKCEMFLECYRMHSREY